MRPTLTFAAAVAAGVVVVAAAGAAVASTSGDDTDRPITGSALEQASAAALEHTGEGRVSDTEVGDEESYYEVEVTLDNGDELDVQLDRSFAGVSDERDGSGSADD